ncbi:hypothetical protein LEP1GSC041_0311 [Leptospira noguchii str. 2006001870]|nr:hypothetical protein LEP1GSC041_0311 [Leptospira noguchii str. 2006001870]EMO26319.1 hypothetical protein LEP1GSC170_5970 [Leptospira interrogans serovar Bataviae str. HAI135]
MWELLHFIENSKRFILKFLDKFKSVNRSDSISVKSPFGG